MPAGAAIAYLDVALPGLPLIPLHHALAADAVPDLGASELEALLLNAADARYRATVFSVVNRWAGPTRLENQWSATSRGGVTRTRARCLMPCCRRDSSTVSG